MAEDASVVNEPVVADTTPTDSTPVETNTDEAEVKLFLKGMGAKVDEPEVEAKTETEDKPTEPEAPATDDVETVVETEDKPVGKAEERKQQLNTEIRELVAERNRIKAEVEETNAKVYQPATDAELLGQINPETGNYYNALEAKVAALEQRSEMERYNSQVADAQLTLSSEASKALQDFPMFDSASKEYKPEMAKLVDELLGANLIIDPNTGQPIGSHVSPYKLYQSHALAAQASEAAGQVKAQKATEKMLANADSIGGDSPKTEKVDPFLKGLLG
jgi:hypothetical protein